MTWRDTIEYWLRRLVPFVSFLLFFAVIIALLLFVPARSAAALLGIIAGVALAYGLSTKFSPTARLAVLWSAIAVTADAAYARLNDQAPVTLANALAKTIDAVLKLAEPMIRALGLTVVDARLRVGAVAPEFVWALILSLVVALAVGVPFVSGRRR
jgi:hypothetical protein